jgi:hypothetical protein
MRTKFGWQKLPTTRMLIVVAVDFGVTFEANWDGILDLVTPALLLRDDVVRFNLDTAEPVTDTAATPDPHQQFTNLISVETHITPHCPCFLPIGPYFPTESA